MSFKTLFNFEVALADYTGAPYAVVTDGCTHAIELCMRYDQVKKTAFTPFTYLSIPMMMHQLGIEFEFHNEEHRQFSWTGEYHFEGTRIWDSARRLEPGMYKQRFMQCLSFGHDKPLSIGRAGAILLDDFDAYYDLSLMRSDGRDLRIEPWHTQKSFGQGYHYCPTLESCQLGIERLPLVNSVQKYQYPDLRLLDFSI